MKILAIWEFYPAYLDYFYSRHPELTGSDYQSQWTSLLQDYYAWPSYLISAFNNSGHEAAIVVGNNQCLQMAWARENGLPSTGSTWQKLVVQEQIRRIKPDILWLGGTSRYLGPFLQQVKEYCRKVVVWVGTDWESSVDYSGVDLVLSSHNHFVAQYRARGMAAEKVLPCFEPAVLDFLGESQPDKLVTFLGTLTPSIFSGRLRMLDYVTRRIQVEVFAEKPVWRRRPFPISEFLGQWRHAGLFLRMRRHPAVYGVEMFRVLQNSKIVLNSHIDAARGAAGNIRMFEATGVRTLLLTENAPNLSEFFVPEKEVVTYSSSGELVEKAIYFRDHEDEGQKIAEAGQARTLQDHNSTVRAKQVLKIFRRVLDRA